MGLELDPSKSTTNGSVDTSPPKIINFKAQTEHMLQNAVLMTEMGMDLKERSLTGEKYVCYLRNLALRAGKTITTLQNSGRTFLLMAQKLVLSVMANIESMPIIDQACYNIKLEYEKLLSVIEKELADIDDNEVQDIAMGSNYGTVNMVNVMEKIRYLETKQKIADNLFLPPSSSTKSVKSDVDEKYPENLSRESLIDLNNVVNLPTVPEDIFTGYSNKPTRTSSLSSLKGIRKVKLFLQRASSASDDEDESSEPEDHDLAKFVGDCDDVKPHSSPKKPFLGNIKEETQQD